MSKCKIIFSTASASAGDAGTTNPNPHEKKFLDEIQERSITPESFDSIEFQESTDEPTFKESYFKGEVLRFGINPFSSSVLEEVEAANGSAAPAAAAAGAPSAIDATILASIAAALTAGAPSAIDATTRASTAAARAAEASAAAAEAASASAAAPVYDEAASASAGAQAVTTASASSSAKAAKAAAGPSSSKSQSKQTESKPIKYTPTEKNVLLQALTYLLENDGNTVICDILERDLRSKTISKDSYSDIPKTHSVLLYKNPSTSPTQRIITVIDPSNFKFSAYLGSQSFDIKDTVIELKTFDKAITIYKPEGKPGPGLDQFRDCIDIAAKLSLRLKKSESDFHTDQEKIKQDSNILAITNQSGLCEFMDIFNYHPQKPFRVKQATDKKYHQILENLFKKLSYYKILHKTIETLEHKIKIIDLITEKNPKTQKQLELAKKIYRILDKMTDYFIPHKIFRSLTEDALRDAYSLFVEKLDIEGFLKLLPFDITEYSAAAELDSAAVAAFDDALDSAAAAALSEAEDAELSEAEVAPVDQPRAATESPSTTESTATEDDSKSTGLSGNHEDHEGNHDFFA